MASSLRSHWTLDPDVVFLNHGAFGACPAPVLDAQARFRAELEREPVRFFERLLETELDRAREQVAAFVGARPDNLAFVTNTTTGVSAVLRSLRLASGDRLLTTNHAYAACRLAIDFVAKENGAEVVVVDVPLPVSGPGDVLDRIVAGLVPRVKLAVIDHVTSPTGLIFPIEDIVRELSARGVETLVDGAHAPGMLPLEVERLGAAYYTGNFHKWVCAPKGAAMLWVRPDRQEGLHPSAISHGYASTRARPHFLEEFDWTGTADPAAWLSVPEAIRFVGGLVPGGWAEVRKSNRALAIRAREIIGEVLGAAALAPESMLGSLAAMPLPDGLPGAPLAPSEEPLHRALFARHRIEVPVVVWPRAPRRLLRISAQLYNDEEDYRALAVALGEELGRG